MKIAVECAMRFAHKSFIEALEANDDPKFTYLGEDPKSKITLLFETNCTDSEEACVEAKKIIKASPLGASASLRVTEVK